MRGMPQGMDAPASTRQQGLIPDYNDPEDARALREQSARYFQEETAHCFRKEDAPPDAPPLCPDSDSEN